MTEQDKQNKISGLVTAIVNKVTSLISIHDNDNNSHSDIRNSIPDPATSNPSADTQGGSVGSSVKYAKADHTHPKSSLYDITVEKQQTAETGYVATYVIKQNNTQVGSKINIPKDFLVKSASVETCNTANSPLNGLNVGDLYLDFVVNSIENDATNSHIYINVSDLVDKYEAGTGLTLTNNAFSVNIADNLTTDNATQVLSAKQGKLLNDNKLNNVNVIDEIEEITDDGIYIYNVFDIFFDPLTSNSGEWNTNGATFSYSQDGVQMTSGSALSRESITHSTNMIIYQIDFDIIDYEDNSHSFVYALDINVSNATIYEIGKEFLSGDIGLIKPSKNTTLSNFIGHYQIIFTDNQELIYKDNILISETSINQRPQGTIKLEVAAITCTIKNFKMKGVINE